MKLKQLNEEFNKVLCNENSNILNTIIKNLDEEPLHIELYMKKLYDSNYATFMYISTDDGSGAEYQVTSVEDVAEKVKFYLTNYYS